MSTIPSSIGHRIRADVQTTYLTNLRLTTFIQAFRALQTAYIRLLQNPFYIPDDHIPRESPPDPERDRPRPIKSKNFIQEVNRVGMKWKPGIGSL